MMKEAVLQEKVFNYYKKKDKNIFSEVPFMSRIIDLVILEDEEITSYELKIKKGIPDCSLFFLFYLYTIFKNLYHKRIVFFKIFRSVRNRFKSSVYFSS